mmetsp:Transcript_55189/g.89452  ORF Transcript_55189/g.89452 Transcript_55189/m.89452 type:complete len:111 (-) Transcript_55189:204-536(-)
MHVASIRRVSASLSPVIQQCGPVWLACRNRKHEGVLSPMLRKTTKHEGTACTFGTITTGYDGIGTRFLLPTLLSAYLIYRLCDESKYLQISKCLIGPTMTGDTLIFIFAE